MSAVHDRLHQLDSVVNSAAWLQNMTRVIIGAEQFLWRCLTVGPLLRHRGSLLAQSQTKIERLGIGGSIPQDKSLIRRDQHRN